MRECRRKSVQVWSAEEGGGYGERRGTRRLLGPAEADRVGLGLLAGVVDEAVEGPARVELWVQRQVRVARTVGVSLAASVSNTSNEQSIRAEIIQYTCGAPMMRARCGCRATQASSRAMWRWGAAAAIAAASCARWQVVYL